MLTKQQVAEIVSGDACGCECSGPEPENPILNALADLMAKFPRERVEIWAASIPGRDGIRYVARVGDNDPMFSSSYPTDAWIAAQEVIATANRNPENLRQVRIAALKAELATLEQQ